MRTTLLSLLIFSVSAVANVNPTRCGRIWSECTGGNNYMFHIEAHISGFPVNTDSLTIDFGNSNTLTVCELTATNIDTTPNGCVLFFDLSHVYSPGTYAIVARFGKHLPNIVNIPNSANIDFCLLCEIVVDPNIGCNKSPISDSLNLEVEWMTTQNNSVGMHVWDPDADSIAWNLIPPTCMQLGYIAPQVAGGGTFSYSQPAETFSWNNPNLVGVYAVVFLFEEYVQVGNQMVIAGVTTREVLIDLDNTLDLEPLLMTESQVFPNPVYTTLTVKCDQESLVQINDMNGKCVFSQIVNAGATDINVAGLAEGIYLLQVGTSFRRISVLR
jgi:hypothetical protein